MTIYNINHGIGWASSGVEYAQLYRAGVLRRLNQPAKFIFTDLIRENIQHLTSNMGFEDEEIIWLYSYFTDIKIAPTTYHVNQLLESIPFKTSPRIANIANGARFYYDEEDFFVTAYYAKGQDHIVERAEFVSKGKLIRKDYYTYVRLYSEYYRPQDKVAKVYLRRFFNEDASVAYEEIIEENQSIYRMQDNTIYYSKQEWIVHFMKSLGLRDEDIVILDRTTGIGQAVFENVKPARLGVVIHADHFSANAVTETTILWNNYYDYQFTNADKVDFFICSTQAQKDLLEKQFKQYTHQVPRIEAIPVGSIDALKGHDSDRKAFSMMTASRLASEKHIDWLVRAVVKAKKQVNNLTFDIYGEGGQGPRLKELIQELGADDYIQLKGHCDLSDIYQGYEAYLSASTSEGFGLTLLEAIGSGLPLVGFDVRYGNQTFIHHGENGFLINKTDGMELEEIVRALSQGIVKMFTDLKIEEARKVSYKIGEAFLTSEVERKWQDLLGGDKG